MGTLRFLMGTSSFLMQLQLDAHNQEAIIAIHYSV